MKKKARYDPSLVKGKTRGQTSALRKIDTKESVIDFVGAQIASPSKRVTWPLFIEKAFAKVFNGYYNINVVNNPVLAFTTLNGAPTSVFQSMDFEDDYTLWDFLVENIAAGEVICFRTCDHKQARRAFAKEYDLFVQDKVKKYAAPDS